MAHELHDPAERAVTPQSARAALRGLPPSVKRALRALHVVRPFRSAATYLKVYALVAVAFWLEARVAHPAFTVLAILFIAGRQHALYLLNHDASHGSLFRGPRANQWVATALSNLPFFHHPEAYSYIMWRRIHRLHHRHLFTAGDPNYEGRRAQGDTRRTYTWAQLLGACCRVGLLSVTQLFVGRQDYVPPHGTSFVRRRFAHLRTLFVPFERDPEMEAERRLKLVYFAVVLSLVAWAELWRPFLLLWILPMYTVYPALLHFMDLTEHRWTAQTEDILDNTRSTWLGPFRWLVCDFHRTLHREHHLIPGVPVVDLPRLSAVLGEAGLPPPAQGYRALLREVAMGG